MRNRLPLLILPVIGISLGLYSLVRGYLPEGGTTEELVAKVNSGHRDTILSGYYYLSEREDPVAVDKALEHVESDEDYIWLNAAHYLGACDRKEAIPYLIKALRHTAWRGDEETLQCLRNLTGEDFGDEFEPWYAWWINERPDFEIDWRASLGHNPRLDSVEQAVPPKSDRAGG